MEWMLKHLKNAYANVYSHSLNLIIFNNEDASTSIFAFYGLLLSHC